MSRTAKEAIYDEQISPLMEQILTICKDNKIAMLADFALGKDPEADDAELKCTSGLLADEHEPTPEMIKAWSMIQPRQASFMAFTITTEPK